MASLSPKTVCAPIHLRPLLSKNSLPLWLAGASAAADQLTKALFPVVITTNHWPLWLTAAAGISLLLLWYTQQSHINRLLLGAITGAAVSNVYDLIRHGAVRDIASVGAAVFNVADGIIVVGLILFVLHAIIGTYGTDSRS